MSSLNQCKCNFGDGKFTTVLWKYFLIKKVEDNDGIFSLKINLFSKLQTLISHSSLISQSFKGTVANLALPLLHGGSLEITRTVPLKRWKRRGQRRKLHILEILLPGLVDKIKTNTYYIKHTSTYYIKHTTHTISNTQTHTISNTQTHTI